MLLTLPISEITVKKDRFRKDFGDIDALAKSINEYGLLQPIVVTETKELLCGERRLRACIQLGWAEIPVMHKSDLSPLQLKEVELEENLQRKDFTWPEICKAKKDIHLLKQTTAIITAPEGEFKEWTLEDTAELIGESVGNLNQDIQLIDAVKDFPELLLEPNKSKAFKKLKKLQKKQDEEKLASLFAQRKVIPVKEFFLNGDCRTILPTLKDGSVDLIITDPPWGVDIDEAGNVGENVEYRDDEEYMKHVTQQAYAEMFRVLSDTGHMYVFYGAQFYSWHLINLLAAGFNVDELPGIWNKTTHGGSNSPTKESNAYEPYFHCWKGKPRPLRNVLPNVHTVNRVVPSKKIHSAEKPVELLNIFIENSTSPGDLVADFFAGSGATLRAALLAQRRAFGCELEEKVYNLALVELEGVHKVCAGFTQSTSTESSSSQTTQESVS